MESSAGAFPLTKEPRLLNSPAALHVVAVFSMLAALGHLWMMPTHIVASVAYGAFFAAMALWQGLLGIALIRWPTRTVAIFGAWGMFTVFAFYAAERLLRDSFAPHAAHASVLELFAMLCTAAQLGLLFAFLMDGGMTLRAAEALSFGIALAYLWEVPNRYAEWWVFGVLFLAVGVCGGLFCLLLPRLAHRKVFLFAGISTNLFLVGAWLATRSVGVPYVRSDGERPYELRFGAMEGVGAGDLISTTMSVSLVVLLASLAAKRRKPHKPPT